MRQKLAILGSTGSIGLQTLDVCRKYPQYFQAEILTAGKNAQELVKQALEFNPNIVVIADESKYSFVADALKNTDIKVFCGYKSIVEVADAESVDTVVLALVGIAGLEPAFAALKAGKKLALANKEVLVVAGELIVKTAIENKASIIPIDSEHSAIFQCLQGETLQSVEKIILTASGGPFRGFEKDRLKQVTIRQALSHPVWDMGNKITIDSATLMNKGFEMIEARWLFDISSKKIDVVVHPQSIIHSMVQFVDGSIKAQMSLPDMRLPILYALTWPDRIAASFKPNGIGDICSLTFEKVNTDVFRHLSLAYQALQMSGGATCILNAANEFAVELFLQDKISFLGMQTLTEKALSKSFDINPTCVADYIMLDKETREYCKTLNIK
jgi:1-deoxy-D-xylulose-5-phosphate reductoisomerase